MLSDNLGVRRFWVLPFMLSILGLSVLAHAQHGERPTSLEWPLETRGFPTNETETLKREIPSCPDGACYGIAQVTSLFNFLRYNPDGKPAETVLSLRQKLEWAAFGHDDIVVNGFSGPSEVARRHPELVKSLIEQSQRQIDRVGQRVSPEYFKTNPEPSAEQRNVRFVNDIREILSKGDAQRSPILMLGNKTMGHALNVNKIEKIKTADGDAYRITTSDRNHFNKNAPNKEYIYDVSADGTIKPQGASSPIPGKITWGALETATDKPSFDELMQDPPGHPGFGRLYREIEGVKLTSYGEYAGKTGSAQNPHVAISQVRGNASHNPAVRELVKHFVSDTGARSYFFDQASNSYKVTTADGKELLAGLREVSRFANDTQGNPTYNWSMALELKHTNPSGSGGKPLYFEYQIENGKFNKQREAYTLDPNGQMQPIATHQHMRESSPFPANANKTTGPQPTPVNGAYTKPAFLYGKGAPPSGGGVAP